jgi:hypothetical protein
VDLVEIRLQCLKLAHERTAHLAADEAIARSKQYEAYILDSLEKVGNSEKSQQDSGKDHTTHSKKQTPK